MSESIAALRCIFSDKPALEKALSWALSWLVDDILVEFRVWTWTQLYRETLRPDRATRPTNFYSRTEMSYMLHICVICTCYHVIHTGHTHCSSWQLISSFPPKICSLVSGHRWKTPPWCVRASVPSAAMTFLFQAVLQNTRGCIKILRRCQEGANVGYILLKKRQYVLGFSAYEWFWRKVQEVFERLEPKVWEGSGRGSAGFADFFKGFAGSGRFQTVVEVSLKGSWGLRQYLGGLEGAAVCVEFMPNVLTDGTGIASTPGIALQTFAQLRELRKLEKRLVALEANPTCRVFEIRNPMKSYETGIFYRFQKESIPKTFSWLSLSGCDWRADAPEADTHLECILWKLQLWMYVNVSGCACDILRLLNCYSPPGIYTISEFGRSDLNRALSLAKVCSVESHGLE